MTVTQGIETINSVDYPYYDSTGKTGSLVAPTMTTGTETINGVAQTWYSFARAGGAAPPPAGSGPISYDGRLGGVADTYAPMDLVPCDVGDLRVVVAMCNVAQTTDVAGWTRTSFAVGSYFIGVWYRYKVADDLDTVPLLCIHNGVKYSYAFSNVGGGALVIGHDGYWYQDHGNAPTQSYQLAADVVLAVDSDTFLVVLGDGAQALAIPTGWRVADVAGTSMMGNVFKKVGSESADTVLSPLITSTGTTMYDLVGIMLAIPNVGSPAVPEDGLTAATAYTVLADGSTAINTITSPDIQWYKFVAPATTNYALKTLGSTPVGSFGLDTILDVYTGDPAVLLTSVGHNDDGLVRGRVSSRWRQRWA